MEPILSNAERLAGAIRQLLELTREGQLKVDEARARAEETSQRFSEAVQRARERLAAGEQSTLDPISRSLTPPGMTSAADDARESARRSIQREAALCDAYDALIAIASVPELKSNVGETAAALREFRVYQAAGHLDELEDLSSPEVPHPPAGAMDDEAARHRWKLDMAERVTRWSRERMDRSRIRHDRAMAESDRLLRTALEAVEQLLKAGRAM